MNRKYHCDIPAHRITPRQAADAREAIQAAQRDRDARQEAERAERQRILHDYLLGF